jgi:hypothetical protein
MAWAQADYVVWRDSVVKHGHYDESEIATVQSHLPAADPGVEASYRGGTIGLPARGLVLGQGLAEPAFSSFTLALGLVAELGSVDTLPDLCTSLSRQIPQPGHGRIVGLVGHGGNKGP